MSETQLGRIQFLLRESSAATGHLLNPEYMARLSVQIQRLMRENNMVFLWQREIDEQVAEMEKR